MQKGYKRQAKGMAVLRCFIGLFIVLIVVLLATFFIGLDYSDKLSPEASLRPYVAETPAPTAAEPTPTPAPPVPAGTYTYVDADGGEWKLELRDDGLFTITDPDGKPHTGEGWSTAADGSVHCGPTDIYFAPFAFNGGCSRWKISGNTCTPLERT